ncbi:MAG: calcium-binding protein [Solirubrobacterales bacterium]
MRKWRKGGLALTLALVALGAFAAVASAESLIGDEADNTLVGTEGHDYIAGHQGNDTLEGKGGSDLIRGGKGDDTERGGTGSDVMFAGPGVDVLMGGRGNDTIFARARADVAEPGADTVFGGPGDDVIFVRDGEPDVVSCGRGFDIVFADPTDIVRPGCERVHVKEPRPHEDASEEVAP